MHIFEYISSICNSFISRYLRRSNTKLCIQSGTAKSTILKIPECTCRLVNGFKLLTLHKVSLQLQHLLGKLICLFLMFRYDQTYALPRLKNIWSFLKWSFIYWLQYSCLFYRMKISIRRFSDP